MCDDRAQEMLEVLGCASSAPFQSLVELLVGAADAAARSYDCGIINKIPLPQSKKLEALSSHTISAWSKMRSPDTTEQTSHAFYAPALAPSRACSTLSAN